MFIKPMKLYLSGNISARCTKHLANYHVLLLLMYLVWYCSRRKVTWLEVSNILWVMESSMFLLKMVLFFCKIVVVVWSRKHFYAYIRNILIHHSVLLYTLRLVLGTHLGVVYCYTFVRNIFDEHTVDLFCKRRGRHFCVKFRCFCEVSQNIFDQK